MIRRLELRVRELPNYLELVGDRGERKRRMAIRSSMVTTASGGWRCIRKGRQRCGIWSRRAWRSRWA